ncbi:380_t:CDS:2, partial [Ambispora gerdemannii]
MSQPQIPAISSEFLTVKSFKEVAQQDAKAAGFAFSCTMGDEYRNNHEITEETRKRKKFTKCQNCSVILWAVLNEDAGVWM